MENWKEIPLTEISEATKLTYEQISYILRKNGITYSIRKNYETAKFPHRGNKREPTESELLYLKNNSKDKYFGQLKKDLNVCEDVLRRWCLEFGIECKKYMHNCAPKKVSKDIENYVINNYLNYPYIEIANKCGISVSTIKKIIDRNNLPLKMIKK